MTIFVPNQSIDYWADLTIPQLLLTAQKGQITPLLQSEMGSIAQSDTTCLCDRWNAVAVHVFGPSGEVCNVTILESAFGENQFLPVADPQGTQIGIQSGASFVCAVGQTFVKAKLDLIGKTRAAGNGWTVYARPFTMPAQPANSALYPSGTTGPIGSGNVATSFTVNLGSLQSVEANQIFDAKQVMVAIANIGTAVAITAATLQFTDTTPGGAALEIAYPIDSASLGSATESYFTIALNGQVLKNVALALTFASAPVAGQVDVQLYFQGGGGLGADPTSGLKIVTAPINAATLGANEIIAAAYANQLIYVVSYVLVADGTVNATWLGGGGGSALSGPIPLIANSGLSIATSAPSFVLNTATGENLYLSLSAAIQVSGHLTYYTRAA